jgi:purine-binding chemotaxis protein CheW
MLRTKPAPGAAADSVTKSGRTPGLRQIVGIMLGDEEYGLDALTVQEIIRIGRITRMPQAPDYVRGLINLHGRVIPIIDLRVRFGFSDIGTNERQRIIVLTIGARTVGLVVDEIDRVWRVKPEEIEPPPAGARGVPHKFVRGMVRLGRKQVILLDVEHLVTDERRPANLEAGAAQPAAM